MAEETPFLILVADCGGTNSRLQLVEVQKSDASKPLERGKRAPGEVIHEAVFLNEEYSKQRKDFTDIFHDFMVAANRQPNMVTVASIAVAGPIQGSMVKFTNNDWSIDGNRLAERFGIREVKLLNDFVACGYGLLTLDEGKGDGSRDGETEEVRVLQKADRVDGAPIACLGAGTGLGQVYLTCPSQNVDSHGYEACASEGGHTDFAPRDELQAGLLQFLKKKFDQKHRVSVERVVSGRGLASIYEYLCQHPDFQLDMNPVVKGAFDAAGDLQGKVVGDNYGKDALCTKAMDIFLSTYGAEAGSCALKFLPYGGLYLAGGLTPKNIDRIMPSSTGQSAFLDAFSDKGRLSGEVKKIPVYAVMDQGIGQRGAHYVAVKLLQNVIANLEAVATYSADSVSPVTAPSASTSPTFPQYAVLAATSFLGGALAVSFIMRFQRG